MAWLEIVDIAQAPRDAAQLDGAHVDLPCPGDRVETAAVPVQGWVAGRKAPAVRVEVVADGAICGSIPVGLVRTDVAAHLPACAWAGRSGFSGQVDLLGLRVSQFQLQATLTDGGRTPLGTVTVRPTWPEGRHPDEQGVVSVIIPCFNQAHFLGDAIESALAQTYAAVDAVVVDDGSTDNTIEIAARYGRVRYVRQENQGLAAARNTGLRRSVGEYVVFLDADDRLRPDAIAVNVAFLRERPACAFVYGDYRHIRMDGSPAAERMRSAVGDEGYVALLRGNYIGMHATVLYRRAVFQEVGTFDESVDACADYDLFLRIARRFPIAGHGHPVADYRLHHASMSADPQKMLRVSLAVLRGQRRFIGHDPRRRAAYKEGLRFVGWYYGELMRARGTPPARWRALWRQLFS